MTSDVAYGTYVTNCPLDSEHTHKAFYGTTIVRPAYSATNVAASVTPHLKNTVTVHIGDTFINLTREQAATLTTALLDLERDEYYARMGR